MLHFIYFFLGLGANTISDHLMVSRWLAAAIHTHKRPFQWVFHIIKYNITSRLSPIEVGKDNETLISTILTHATFSLHQQAISLFMQVPRLRVHQYYIKIIFPYDRKTNILTTSYREIQLKTRPQFNC